MRIRANAQLLLMRSRTRSLRDQALYHNPSSDVKGQASKCAQRRSGQRAGSTPAETHAPPVHRWLEHFQVTTEAWQARPSRTSFLHLRPWRA
jgi:hypothetical protein